ncbi:MAG: heme-binding protein [Pseudolabrys sp.]
MTYINTKAVTLALLAASSAALLCPASAELIQRKDLSYATALAIATGALDACKARGYATGVVVLDRGGNVMISLRADNAGLHTVENARRKAYTSLTFKITTSTFIEEMKTKPFRREQTNLPSVIAIDGACLARPG